MGNEWLSWGRGGGGGGGNRREKMKEAATASAGCMSAVLNLFHLRHFQFASAHRNDSNTYPNIYPFLQEEAITATGLEAPRNSLELAVTAAMAAALTPLAMKQEENFNFPVGIRIKTSHDKISSPRISRLDDIYYSQSSSCNSSGTKTPSVVARLMGLDLLPESNPPSISNPRKDTSLLRASFSDDAAVRSLPETPRTSSSSRKSDVERHRLSLQINKENTFKHEFSLSNQKTVCRRRRGRFKKDDDRRSSFGLDITNSNTNRNSDKSKTDQNLLLLKPNKKNNSKISSKNGKEASPRSRISSSYDINHQTRDSKKLNDGKCLKKLPARTAAVDGGSQSRREKGGERNKLHLAGKKSEALLRVKNGPSPLHTKLPRKQSQSQSQSQSQVSNKPSKSYSQLRDRILSPCSTNGGAAALHGGSSRNYVEKILKHTGLTTQVNPLAKWHTPIDPAVFHSLEFKAASVDKCDAVPSRRSERKLIFQLVDELLAQVFTSPFKLKLLNRWISPVACFPVVEELCKRIESFPAAKCVVLEDIDSLIERDLCGSQSNGYWVEEEMMVCEIEGEIVEWLVHEAVAVMGGAAAEEQTEVGVCRVGV